MISGAIWRNNGIAKRAEKHSAKYLQVQFQVDGRKYYVYAHRVVWMYINEEEIPPGYEINHLNGEKCDNNPGNLECVTPQENCLHATRVLGLNRGSNHGRTSLTEDDVREIRRLTETKVSKRSIAEKFGISPSCVSHIRARRTWGHVT
jgi:hypothetical protein